MHLTLIQPAIGHREGEEYIRTWQMEPLPIAAIAGLTPGDVTLAFHDDRLEHIPFDAPTDAVALPVETFTAGRAYQIASEYRRRGVPVVMGGFHPTLLPEEAERYADAIVIGEAEDIWANVVDDLRHRTLQRRYVGNRPSLARIRVDRRPFRGKRYLPLGLVETGRGCRFACEFCSIQAFFESTYRARPADDVTQELASLKDSHSLFFLVDDNFAGDIKGGKPLLHELEGLGVRWVTQISINAAHDEDFVARMKRAGCGGVLVGFESLNTANLRSMRKSFNMTGAGYRAALATLRRHGIGVYGTFMFGYDEDVPDSFRAAVDFASSEEMFLAAFSPVTPFPGTPLYRRLEAEGRLRYGAWWNDRRYRYNTMPFVPRRMAPEQVREQCIAARRRFFRWSNVLRRSRHHLGDAKMLRTFFVVNALHRREISQRDGYPLGDENWRGNLLEVQ